jgi:benzylsuccinate CoA-transferase BbsF subunit
LPFEGVKIADFSWIGVGPITAKYLADHGATVVRVETEHPADRLRLVGPFKDNVAGVNRCQFFASFNTSKMSLALNLKRPEGLEVAKRLIGWADICLDSFTAGTMAELGLGYEVARELNPSVIMASTCLLGQTGPAARLAGCGYPRGDLEFYEITGWDAPRRAVQRLPTRSSALLAATLMAALDHRRRTGRPDIWPSTEESSLYFLAPGCSAISSAVACGGERRVATDAPHDAYPCAGETSGARSPSKPMRSGSHCDEPWAIRNGRRWPRSPRRPGDSRGETRSGPSSRTSRAGTSRAR